MLFWILLLSFLSTSINAIGQPRYECGEHGRFDYCIDGNPGCVVGCHCHPGYYFDTDTKICEPNAKLVHEYRRLFVAEPTRVPVTPVTLDNFYENEPTPTTTDAIDSQVDNIAKNPDDLGDWLYNQFFKTIENQVINKTDDHQIVSRRSGGTPVIDKSNKHKRKKIKKLSNKQKRKNKGLRRKLLRITEDDSLFDSRSDYDGSSDSSSSSSDSDMSSEGIVTRDDRHDDDKEHGHRKIIVFNKKPKPPLPSFIFLPNYETPFYPPIGLSPPALPMYPMVPVPPVPMFPYQGPVMEVCKSTTSVPTLTQGTTPTTVTKVAETSKITETTVTTEPTTKQDDAKNDYSKDEEKKPNVEPEKKDEEEHKEPGRAGGRTLSRGQRNQLLRQQRQQMHKKPNKKGKERPKRIKKPTLREEQAPEEEPSVIDDFNAQGTLVDNELKAQMQEAPVEDVDFKYLAQLIHKVDPNNTNEKINNYLNEMQQPLRRHKTNFKDYNVPRYQNKPTRRFENLNDVNEQDDSYYAKLGQQIASLIRRLDAFSGQHQIDLDIEKNQEIPKQLIFSENNFAPRSFWERSVRSPPTANQFSPIKEEYNYSQKNYENLFKLENKVENLATTSSPLSLQQLENAIFLMHRAKSQLRKNIKHANANIKHANANIKHANANIKHANANENSQRNININLLPHHNGQLKIIHDRYGTTNLPHVNETKTANELINFLFDETLEPQPDQKNNKPNRTTDEFVKRNVHYNLKGILLENLKNIMPKLYEQKYNNITFSKQRNSNLLREARIKLNNELNYRIQTLKEPLTSPKQPHNVRMNNINESFEKSLTTQLRPKHQVITASIHKYKNINNYYLDKANKYILNKQSAPFQSSIKLHYSNPVRTNPLYFHRSLTNFDYFD